MYLRARYYNGNQGRFFQEDTYLGEITDPLTLNRYAYVKNSPLNYVDPSGHVADYLMGGSSQTGNSYGAALQGKENAELIGDVNKEVESVCGKIAETLMDHGGALAGGTAGVAIMMLTAPAAAPALAIVGAGMVAGAIGLALGGLIHKGIDSAMIAHELKTKYGINVQEYQDIDLSAYPEEAQGLCEQYEDAYEDSQMYLDASTTLGMAGMLTYDVGMLLDSIGGTVKAKSKSAFDKVKNWFNSTFKGESNTVKPTQEGVDTIKEHLSGDMQADFNDAMIDRIENTLKKGGKLEGPDAEFYRHELEESRLMQQGLDYDMAHNAALDKYGVREFDLYHPDIIKEMPEWFGPAWFEYWGISR